MTLLRTRAAVTPLRRSFDDTVLPSVDALIAVERPEEPMHCLRPAAIAAAAAGFTLQIVEPHLNGPGGDCPIILHSVALGSQQVICGQGPAPRGF